MNLLASTPAVLPTFLCGALALKYSEDFIYMNRNKANQKHFKSDRITQLIGTILYGALTAAYLLALSGRFAALNVGTITPFAIGGTLILAASHIGTGYSTRAKKVAAKTFVALVAISSLALFISQKRLNT